MKGQPKQYKSFNTRDEAISFMEGLKINPECECYGIEKN